MTVHFVKASNEEKCFSSENLREKLFDYLDKFLTENGYLDDDQYSCVDSTEDVIETLMNTHNVIIYNHPSFGCDFISITSYTVE